MPRVVWYIVDGAAAWAVRELLAMRLLPHLASVVRAGGWRPAIPSYPPCATPSGLATLVTGRSAAEHGVLGRRVPSGPLTWTPGFATEVLRAEPVWASLRRAGSTVGLAQMPWVRPEDVAAGVCAIDGLSTLLRPAGWRAKRWDPGETVWRVVNLSLDAAARAALGTGVDPRAVEAAARAPGHGDPDLIRSAATALARASVRAAGVLADTGPDVLVSYQPCLDAVAHQVLTPEIVTGTDRRSARWELFVAAHRLADEHLGELLSRVDGRATVVVSSDHGMDARRVTVNVNSVLDAAGLAVRGPSGEIDDAASDVYCHPAENGLLVLGQRAMAAPHRVQRRIFDVTEALLRSLRADGAPVIDGVLPAMSTELGRTAWIRARPGVQLRARPGEPAVRHGAGKGFHQLFHGQRELLGIAAAAGPSISPRWFTRADRPVDNRRLRGLIEYAVRASGSGPSRLAEAYRGGRVDGNA